MYLFFLFACHPPQMTTTSPSDIRIPAGQYDIGPDTMDDAPAHSMKRTVTLTYDYIISPTELTIGEWLEVDENLPSQYCQDAPTQALTTQHPVRCISWCEAVIFANRKSKKEGRTPAYDFGESADDIRHPIKCNEHAQFVQLRHNTDGWRLPTEAEWEIASRIEGEISAKDYAWFAENAKEELHPVASKRANPQGLFDTQGNLHEWIWERFGEFRSPHVYDPMTYEIPIPELHTRPIKGGSYSSKEAGLRPSNRPNASPSLQHPAIGFRLVYTSIKRP